MQPQNNLPLLCRDLRRTILAMIHAAKSSHIGTAFSCVEILAALYFNILNIDPQDPEMEGRDIFILSKGHGVAALYATLAKRGFFPESVLERYGKDGSTLAGHIVRHAVPGAESSGGSGGHGLSLGIGHALASRHKKTGARVYVLMGDGELAEGSVWEAALFAGFRTLTNLTLIIDRNHLQIMGRTEDVLDTDPVDKKFESFNWRVLSVDGHDTAALTLAFETPSQDKPKVIIAHTTKGKGVSFMEHKAEWHGKFPNDDEYARALQELT